MENNTNTPPVLRQPSQLISPLAAWLTELTKACCIQIWMQLVVLLLSNTQTVRTRDFLVSYLLF